MRHKTILFLFTVTFLSLSSHAWAWNGISHYHINRGVGIEPSVVFGVNGTGPDMSVQWVGKDPQILDENGEELKWPDYFHSPDPKYDEGKRPFSDKPNFAYLMLKVSERDGASTDMDKARALGWGGHIAADWVAHNDNLFPICPSGSTGEKKHFIGECLCELYSFLTKGPIISSDGLSLVFDDRQIYKALLNYRLIMIHEYYIEKQQKISEQKLKEKALSTTLPKSYIRQRIKRWVAKLAVIQFAYASRPGTWGPVKRALFVSGMQRKGVESNLALSQMSAYAWTHNLRPRGGIPDYSNQVVPFYSRKLMSIPAGNSLNSATYAAASINTAQQSPAPQEAQPVGIGAEEEDMLLWQATIDSASQKGYLTIDETETADGLYLVNVDIKDEDGLSSIIEQAIKDSVASGEEQAVVAGFWKKLLIDGVADVDTLTDISSPTLELVSPHVASYVNVASPELSVRVLDGPDGTGIDQGAMSLSIDGVPISYTFDGITVTGIPPSKLREGLHTASAVVSDSAGNSSRLEWSFIVDTISPKLCYRAKLRQAGKSQGMCEVTIIPYEPVKYILTVLPVVDGRTQNDIVYRKEFGQPKTVTWDSTNSDGSRVTDGDYVMRIQAVDRAGNIRFINAYMNIRNKT